MAHVRTFQMGPHAALSQKLLNELSQAKLRLLDPTKKAAYDTVIRSAAPADVSVLAEPQPADNETVQHLVATYAGDENEHQRQMFEDSLRAALTVEEMRELVTQLGFPSESVQPTSDRHWTWIATRT